MTITQVWGALLIFIACPLLGGLPLIDWIARTLAGKRLAALGTGNISVSAAFYHGGRLVGILAAISEAFKGILAVLLARAFFPAGSAWELLALMALVMGRYWLGRGAGTTNVFWGIVAYDWQAAALSLLLGGISFTIFRARTSGRLVGLFLLALILSLRHASQSEVVAAAFALAGLLAWIYQKIPDDLDLPVSGVSTESRTMFRFFRGDGGILSLQQKLAAEKVGQKAATLSYLKRLGYPIPDGWVLAPGDDVQPLLDWLEPSPQNPFAVRSSAIGEDGETASAAGQYLTILNVTSRPALQAAIIDCLTSYESPAAIQYRRDRQQGEAAMAVLVQKQIRGVFSGVAFSRNPVHPGDGAVVIEALPGEAQPVVSGRVTPQRYQVDVSQPARPDTPEIIQSVAILAREIEDCYHGIPQDVEWTYDGQQLWLLQARTITNLQPIWTRRIAAEVIPGVIRPLTWSLNRPLTCGVWGEIFTLVLGRRAADLDFRETAALYYQHAYFNATLLGEIFRRMGLPPESLEFLTRGAKFTKPPLTATLRNLPGLLRLLGRERKLERDFEKDSRRYFLPTLEQLEAKSPSNLSPEALLERIEEILAALKRATYYSILAPLSLALRQAIAKIPPDSLDNSQTPEVASLRALQQLAADVRRLFPGGRSLPRDSDALWTYLQENPQGEEILAKFQAWLSRYGYLSEVGTDIAVPRWQENPQPVRDLLWQFALSGEPATSQNSTPVKSRKSRGVQKRLNLKGRATAAYSQLLAHLRGSFLALEEIWLTSGLLSQAGDIFFLEYEEIRRLIRESETPLKQQLPQLLSQRRQEFQGNRERPNIPDIAYGNPETFAELPPPALKTQGQLQGIAASPGQAVGKVKILRNLQGIGEIDRETILVVPYTDSGWAPLLAHAGGLIAEVGGSLSHGAIVAREYGIPAVMDVHNATQLLSEGQRVRIDGQRGMVEILEYASGRT